MISACLSLSVSYSLPRFGNVEEHYYGRRYGGRTRISRRYMRALTQTNARARGYSRGVRECARMFLIRMMLRASREGSRGAPAGPVPAPDEDNASLPLSYEPGPAIINSSKHSFSYTQLYVVLSPTKRSPPMSFSMPAMALIAGLLPRLDGHSHRDLRVHRQ